MLEEEKHGFFIAPEAEILHTAAMEFPQNLAGKWVAVKKEKAIDAGRSLKALTKRVTKRSDHAQIRFSFVPKGGMAGISYGI